MFGKVEVANAVGFPRFGKLRVAQRFCVGAAGLFELLVAFVVKQFSDTTTQRKARGSFLPNSGLHTPNQFHQQWQEQ